MTVSDMFKCQPVDPIEFMYRENWITLSSIGSIFTFALVGTFRSTIFDKLMLYVLPVESFEYMRFELPDIGSGIESGHETDKKSNIIEVGAFVRESIIWIFMVLLLYLLAVFIRFPDIGGGNSGGSAIM